MKKTFLLLLITVLLFAFVACDGNPSVNEPSGSGSVENRAFSIGSEKFKTLQDAVDFLATKSVSKDFSVEYTIKLNADVVDEGAVIPDISCHLVLDFGNYTYTLSDGSKGIVINNPDGTTIQNGSITLAPGASLSDGTKAVITTQTALSVSDIKLVLEETSENGIEASSAKVDLSGAVEITTKGDKKTIVATENAHISVAEQSSVVLTGSLKMQDNAVVNLGSATVNLTSAIEKGEDVSFYIDNSDNIKPDSSLDVDAIQSLNESIGEALHNHEWVTDTNQSQEPSCTEEGVLVMVCSINSNHIKEIFLPATGHSFSEEWTADDDNHWHVATCGHEVIDSNSGHNWGGWVITLEATHTTAGEKTRTCTVCGKEDTDEIPANSDAHTFSEEWSFDATYHWHEVICEHIDAVEKKKHSLNSFSQCTVCGYKSNWRITSWHGYNNDEWMYCGVIPDSKQDITGFISIPEKLGDLIVDRINEFAFEGCTGLLGIEIPSSVTYIREGAFNGCTGLTKIEIPASVERIGYWNSYSKQGEEVFNGCTCAILFAEGTKKIPDGALFEASGITSVTIPDSVMSIGEGAFFNCTALTEIEIPASVTRIGDYAFYGCTGLTKIVIPASVTSIGKYAFYGCTGLTEIIIESPSDLKTIGDYAFSGCTSLIAIEIPASVTGLGYHTFENCMCSISFEEGMENIPGISGASSLTSVTIPSTAIHVYSMQDCSCPVIFAEGMIDIPDGFGDRREGKASCITSVTIPSTVVNITGGAFQNCTGLTEVIFNGSSSLESIGDNAFYGCMGLTEIEIPASVTEIEDSAFSGCTGLTEIEIPSSVTSIGNRAFKNCNGLKSIKIYSTFQRAGDIYGDGQFAGCTGSVIIGEGVKVIPGYAFGNASITSVNISASVTEIEDSAFSGCTNLTEIIFDGSSSLESIGVGAFAGCTSLKEIEIPASVSNLGIIDDFGYGVFQNCTCSVSFAEGMISIPAYALMWAPGIASVTIPSSVTSIGHNAFDGCAGLTEIEIPVSVTSIGEDAFRGCTCSVSFAEGMISIPDYALEGASRITSVTIPTSVTSIGYNAFGGCTGLTEIEIPASVTSIGGYAFSHCSGLSEIEIPASVTSIGYSAFSYCTGLTEIVFNGSSSLESIGDNAFYGCMGLTEIEIPASVTSIEEYAFKNCTCSVSFAEGTVSIPDYALEGAAGITSVSIPPTVTKIGFSAFGGCVGLSELEIPASVTIIDNYAFSGCYSLVDIYFIGTMSDWELINKTGLWKPNAYAVVHCADGDIPI